MAGILLDGCSQAAARVEHASAVFSLSRRQMICIDGVEYIAVPVSDDWTITPHYKADGSLYTCANSVERLR